MNDMRPLGPRSRERPPRSGYTSGKPVRHNLIYKETLSSMCGFWTDISKCSEREGDHFFSFHRDIRNKKVCKVKNFQVWVASRYFE